jgi:hypothetical protein
MTPTGTDERQTTAAQTVANPFEWLPCPLVDWSQLAASVAPGKPVSRSRLRTLRGSRHISAGVKVTHRGETGVSGASSYYSVLSLWAERARSLGFDDDAKTLTSAASSLEDEFAQPLKDFLSRHPFRDLPDADFFWTLADKTVRVLLELKTWHDAVVAVASVTEVDGHFAHLEGSSMEGTPRSVDLPRHLAETNGLNPGSCVFVLSRTLGTGAYVEVDQAVPSRERWLAGLRSGCFDDPQDPRSTENTEDESGLRDYNAGPGAPLTRELAARAWQSARDAGLTPTPLRPAG